MWQHKAGQTKTSKSKKLAFSSSSFFLYSSSNTASCQICSTISALLQDELLFVKARRRFSAEPVSQQSQALTLLHFDTR